MAASDAIACGFECGVVGVTGSHVPSTSGTAPTIDTGTFRTGLRSLKCSASAGTSVAQLSAIAFTTSAHSVGRIYVNFEVLPDADTAIISYGAAANGGPSVEFQQSDSSIYAGVRAAGGAATLGSTGVAVTTGVWYCIDFSFFSDGAGGSNDTSDVQVDGSACGQASATGTSVASGSGFIGMLQTCTATIYFDDFASSYTTASYPLGAGLVRHFVPTSDGTHNVAGANDFERSLTGVDITNSTTDAFLLVDDVPLESGTPSDFINLIAPPAATDYVECIFGPAPGVSTYTQVPGAVSPIIAYAAAATGPDNLRVAMNDNGSLADIINASVGSTTCKYTHIESSPLGGTWVLGGGGNGDFNNLRFRCFTSDANPDPYLVSIMLEADFIPEPPVPALEWYHGVNEPSSHWNKSWLPV